MDPTISDIASAHPIWQQLNRTRVINQLILSASKHGAAPTPLTERENETAGCFPFTVYSIVFIVRPTVVGPTSASRYGKCPLGSAGLPPSPPGLVARKLRNMPRIRICAGALSFGAKKQKGSGGSQIMLGDVHIHPITVLVIKFFPTLRSGPASYS